MIRFACTEAVAQLTLEDTVTASTTVPSVLKMLNDADSAVREAAARSLGTLHGKAGLDRDSVIAALAKAAVDINPLVASAATAALKSFGLAPNKIGEMKMKQSIYGNTTHNSSTYNLTAGPIRMKYVDGELRYLYVGEKEIVRRIYFAVRDLRFDTTMPVFTRSTVTPGKDHFTIHLEAECKSATADFGWTGDIKGSADGTITFKVSGKPNSVFTTPRIGFCVLYGTPSLSGQAYTVSDRDGKPRAGAFPTEVTPGEIEANFSSLSYITTDGMLLSCAVTGQGFHMEDQRNFGDSSYKAYHSLAYPPNTNLTVGDVQGDALTLHVQHATVKPAMPPAPTRIVVGAIPGALVLPKISFTDKPVAGDTFVSINGDRKKYTDAKSFVYAYNPAWHMPDEDTFMENLPAIIDQVHTARTFLPAGTPIRIEPLTFDSPYPRPSRDARNQGLFSAAWLTNAIAKICNSGVDDVVTTVGPGPADRLIKEWGMLAGRPVLPVTLTSALPKPLEAFGVKDGDGALLWLVNLTDTPQVCIVNLPAGNEVQTMQQLTMAGWNNHNGPLDDKQNPTIQLAPYEVWKVTMK